MYHSNKELLLHIFDEVNYVLKACAGKTKDDLMDDETLKRAVIRSLEIIGEAGKKIDAEFKAQHPHIDWRGMAGTRDKLIHDYFGVNYNIVWDIIINELPTLEEYLKEIIIDQK